MKDFEKIFDESAKKTMIEWNLESFKRTHPRLFKSIINAMSQASKPNDDRIKELSEGVKIGLEAIQELHEFQDGWGDEEKRLHIMINDNPDEKI